MACNRESLLLKEIANGIMSTMLLVSELGVRPDLSSTLRINHLQNGTQKKKTQLSVWLFTSWFTWRRDSSSVARAASTDSRTSSVPTVERVMVEFRLWDKDSAGRKNPTPQDLGKRLFL